MKIIVAGGRDFKNYDHLFDVMDWYNRNGTITEVVSGKQRTRNPDIMGVDWGADYIGELWASQQNITITPFPAEWEKYGKKAGMIRNRQMADYADALIAFHDGKSRGTHNMIRIMEKLKKPNVVFGYGEMDE